MVKRHSTTSTTKSEYIPLVRRLAALDLCMHHGIRPFYLREAVKVPSLESTYAKLSDSCKTLIAVALGKTTPEESDLAAFVAMHPGERDLAMRNFISAQWKTDWKGEPAKTLAFLSDRSIPNWHGSPAVLSEEASPSNLEYYKSVRSNLYHVLSSIGVREPSQEEKLEAVTHSRTLTDNQRFFLSAILNITPIGSDDRPLDVADVYYWFDRADETNKKLFCEIWRGSDADFLNLSAIIHHLLFTDKPEFPQDHAVRLNNARLALSEKLPSTKMFSDLLALCKTAEGLVELTDCALGSTKPIDAILESAQKQCEFDTLAEFLGIPITRPTAKLDYTNCISKAS
ncbi:hypothetical protein HZC07_00460, partial [Candidatus Micrarchaeota archaeon]|nr:hypothetical protein [Candidatus Micrarchaeota archaeon]